MTHGKHLYVMGGLALLAGILLYTGAFNGGGLLLLWLVGCGAMMFFMMRGMGSGHGHHDGQDTSHDDADDKRTFAKRHP